MSTSVFHRRRAERFAQLFDEAGGARRHHVRSRADGELTDLVGIGQRLARIEVDVRADPEFRDGLRAMLMATIEREGIGVTAVRPEPAEGRAGVSRGRTWQPALPSRRARGAVVVGLTVGTLAVSGMSAASGDAIPGDTLYGVKRSTERAQKALAGSDIGLGQLNLEFAKTRLTEATAVGDNPAELAAVLDDMDAETVEGARLLHTAAVDRRDPAALDVIDAFVGPQREGLAGLFAEQTGASRARAARSLHLLDDVAKRSESLRSSLRCADATSVRIDGLGPLPGQCSAQGPTQPQTGARTPAERDTDSRGTRGATAPVDTEPAPGTPTGTVGGPVPAGTPSTPSKPEDSKPADDELIDKLNDLLGGAFD